MKDNKKNNPLDFIDKIYVLHVKGCIEREKSVEKQAHKLGFDFEYITDYDIANLTQEQMQPYIAPKSALKSTEKSLIMKHLSCLKKGIENNFNFILVLEDDVIFKKKFLSIIEQAQQQITSINHPAVISIGSVSAMQTAKGRLKADTYLYKNQENRAADSYIINISAMKNRLAWFENNKTNLPADHMHNLIDNQQNNIIYWLEPSVCFQGGEWGYFTSTISPKSTHRLVSRIMRLLSALLKHGKRKFIKPYSKKIKYQETPSTSDQQKT